MSKIKSTTYFLVLVLLVILTSTFVLANMNKIIPSYTNEVFTYSNIYSNSNQNKQGIDIISEYLETANYYKKVSYDELEEYMENEILINIIGYITGNGTLTKNEMLKFFYNTTRVRLIPDTIFGNVMHITYKPTTSLHDSERTSSASSIAFSEDCTNIYFSMYDLIYDSTYEFYITEETEISVDNVNNIIEKSKEILQNLKVTDYFTFEPESVWLSETASNTYIIKDSKNNIEVHYNSETMNITGLVIGFNFI